MQTKVELQGKLSQQLWKEPVALNSAERSLTDWAMVDDHQAILDVNCVRDHLLRHYLSNYRVRACGLCLDAQQAHHMRQTLSGAEIMYSTGVKLNYKMGTMIEVPRAALLADQIAEYADFFSFGTNDLTQTTFGYSRDDAEHMFLYKYINKKILQDDPFATLDTEGVGRLIKIAHDKGRSVKSNLSLGICGEHGGDPRSIEFCYTAGLNYVSCSPYRVPVARLAAAQATIKHRDK